ncbi:putative cysteine desulfurase [Candidatus Protochlamydia naegleriophila]|uniref:cysteine desulfurase n=1 Tax=Candidatus Protochlamydia naegleriophila TaxID=389348 RepID=A0A0U5J9P3_9BACT|nr:cysteine desulfurase [Candidatus Protochlamydia naegleriophila]CUI15831.1 putative cysteine desulfurase [Candidatus Protochlamydia naegleriophila]
MKGIEQLDVKRIRQDFPMLGKTMHGHPLVYLDSAATSQKPQVVIDCIDDFYRNHYGTVHRAVYELAIRSSEDYQKTRHKVKAFLNASQVEEIIFTRGTTESINMVAYSFGKAFVRPGDEILISAMEHHSNIVPWQLLCEDRGATLKVIPMNEKGELLFDEYVKLLSPKTKLVAVTHVANSLGTINPVKEIVEKAHEAGAKVLVDGAQSAPHLKIDVQELGMDFFVFSGHKLMGPTGIGILYGKAELLDQMPPYQGGGDMIETVTFSKTTYNVLPLKFEAGTPMIAEVMGLGAAIDYLNQIGLDNIQAYEHRLLEYATDKLSHIPGLRIIGQAAQKGALISFVIDGIHSLDIGTLLDLKGIAVRTGHHCAQPVMKFFNVPATARASFAFYNTFEEIDQLDQALHDSITCLK